MTRAGDFPFAFEAALPRSDARYMLFCLRLARAAAAREEVPVGALVVHENKVLSAAHNMREVRQSPVSHAELLAIEEAAAKLGSWRLDNCTLYVTLEPCPMCAGTVINARVPRVVFGAPDPKAGAMGSLYDIGEGKLNHTPLVTGGLLSAACGRVISSYFRSKRAKAKEGKKNAK